MNDDPLITSAPNAAQPIRAIGPYRVVREIGRGGMGAVYLCEDTAVGDRPVALKVVLDPEQGGREAYERFQREIRHLGTLRHRNIVQVLFAGVHEGRPYFVMEYVPGRDLARRLDELRTMPEHDRLAEAVRLMTHVADGVAFAHKAGTVHRDLKPQNIIVREDGEPMILDFGIARRSGDVSMTGTGPAPGTPSFMAPEQFEGAVPDGAPETADVWALGALLYLALTGEKPFKARSIAAVAYQVVHQAPIAPRQLAPAIPEAVEAVVLKALEKDPRRRYPTAEAFRDALVAAAASGQRARVVRSTARIAVLGLAALALAVFLWRPWERNLRPTEQYATVLRVERRDVGFDAEDLDVATFDPVFAVALAEVRQGASASAVLLDPQGFELSRVPLNPAGLAFEAAFRIAPDLRREGLAAVLRIEIDGRPVSMRPAKVRFLLDASPPQVVATLSFGDSSRTWPEGAADDPPVVPIGTILELRTKDAGRVVECELFIDGVRSAERVAPDGQVRVPLDRPGDREIALRARDRAGNEDRRVYRIRVAAPESRPEGVASSRTNSRPIVRRDLKDLPVSFGRLERLGATTDFTRAATLELRDGVRVLVRSELGPFELEWFFRLRDSSGSILGACRLEPGGLLGTRSYLTVSGTLQLAGKTPQPGALSAEFVLRDREGAEVVRAVPTRIEWRAARPPAIRPRVRFDTSAGSFTIELDRGAAPGNVATFLSCVETGFYAETIVHDVVSGVYVAAGRYTPGLAVKVDRTIAAAPNEWDRPGALRNVAGTVALAHEPGDPDSARGRFIVNLTDQPASDVAKFTVVGRVVVGLDVLKKIAAGTVERRGELARVPLGPIAILGTTVE